MLRYHRLIFLVTTLALSLPLVAAEYECKASEAWPDHRYFQATLKIEISENIIEATLTRLYLSEVWPLGSHCKNPINNLSRALIGYANNGEMKLSTKDDAECGFVLFLSINKSIVSMLSPRKSYKVFGEKPYLAQCELMRP